VPTPLGSLLGSSWAPVQFLPASLLTLHLGFGTITPSTWCLLVTTCPKLQKLHVNHLVLEHDDEEHYHPFHQHNVEPQHQQDGAGGLELAGFMLAAAGGGLGLGWGNGGLGGQHGGVGSWCLQKRAGKTDN
jgi:hypothetical protein